MAKWLQMQDRVIRCDYKMHGRHRGPGCHSIIGTIGAHLSCESDRSQSRIQEYWSPDQQKTMIFSQKDWMRDEEELEEVIQHEFGEDSDHELGEDSDHELNYSGLILLCVSICACLILCTERSSGSGLYKLRPFLLTFIHLVLPVQ